MAVLPEVCVNIMPKIEMSIEAIANVINTFGMVKLAHRKNEGGRQFTDKCKLPASIICAR